VQKWSGGTPEEWAQESYSLARAVVYQFPSEAGDRKITFPVQKDEKDSCGSVPLHRLNAGYRDRAIAAVKQQLAKAGIRLAAMLRESLH
jgi:hypothetical protein